MGVQLLAAHCAFEVRQKAAVAVSTPLPFFRLLVYNDGRVQTSPDPLASTGWP